MNAEGTPSYALHMSLLSVVVLAAASLMSLLGPRSRATALPPPPVTVGSSLEVSQLQPTVGAVDGEPTSVCSPLFFGARVCGPLPWQRVGPRQPVNLADGRSRTCLWVHPSAGETLRIDVPLPSGGVALDALALDVMYGLLPDSAERVRRGDATLSVYYGGCALGSWSAATRSWQEERVNILRRIERASCEELDRDAGVELRVESTQDHRRLLCVDLRWLEITGASNEVDISD